jgi:predicted transposase/invertase (TIGR01784 family)
LFNNIDPNDPNIVLSPLADPVASAILANVEVAGRAVESIIRAVLKSDNIKLKGKIIRVTPQRIHTSPWYRGCRVDVEVESDANEYFVFEIQIAPDKYIMVRDLFSASHVFTEKSNIGDTSAQMALKMPRIIYINILGYNIRGDNIKDGDHSEDLVQPFKILYTKPPQEVAVPNFSGYNIQLPRVLDMKPDFTNSLYCWAYTLYTAHSKEKTIKEVLDMTPELQSYAQQDTGYQQFCDQYHLISADPKNRREYALWVNDRMREEGMKAWARDEGEQEGILAVAINLLQMGLPVDKIAVATGLAFDEIEAARVKL